MAVISVPGPISGKGYKFRIAGDSPTVDEQRWIDSNISQREQAFRQDYESKYGDLNYDEGEGFLNYLGEIPKGLARGAVGLTETAGLGLATLLPEDYEAPTREFIRRQGYNWSPQADIGLEDSGVATVSEGIGSIVPIYAASMIPGVGIPLSGALAVGAGAGEASERARAAGATESERNKAALLGAGVGALDLVPVFGSMKKFLGPQVSNKLANYLINIAMEGGEEAAQEATTQVLQNMIQQGYDPDQDLGEGTLASAGVGGLAGALIAAILPGRTAPASAPPPAAPPSPATPAATTPAAPVATPAAPAAPPVPGYVDTVTSESLPSVTPKAPPVQEESQQDELRAETAADFGLEDFAVLQSVHDRVSATQDKIGALTQVAAELGISPETAKKMYDATDHLLNYEKTKQNISPELDAAIGQPKLRGKKANVTPPVKVAPNVGTQGTAPTGAPKVPVKRYNALRAAGLTDEQINSMTPEEREAVLNPAAPATPPKPTSNLATAPAPTEQRVMQVLKKAREQQAAGKNQLVSKSGAQSLVDAGLLSPEDMLIAPTANARVADLLALGPDEVKARMAKPAETPAPAAAVAPEAETPTPAPEPKFKFEEGAPFTRPLTDEEYATLSDADKARYQADPNMPPTREMLRERDGNTTPAIWASKDFDIPVELMPEPAQTDPKTGEKYQKVRQQDGNIGFVPVSQLRPAPSNKPAPPAPDTAAGAIPGQITGAAGQIIPEPNIKPTRSTVKMPKAEKNMTERERAAAEQERVANEAMTKELFDVWFNNMAKTPGLAELSDELSDVLGKYAETDEAGGTQRGEVMRNDITNSGDKRQIIDLLKTNKEKQLKGAENLEARAAQVYFSKTRNPTVALELMAYDAEYMETDKYRTPPDMKGTPEAAMLLGTGKAVANNALRWVSKNLSPEAQKFIRRVEREQAALKRYEAENTKRKDTVEQRREVDKILRATASDINTSEVLDAEIKAKRKADEANMAAFDERVKREAQREAQKAKGKTATLPTPPWAKLLQLNPRTGLLHPLHPVVKAALQRGDLKTALNALAATSVNPRLARMAEKLASKTGGTTVRVVSGLTNYKGQPISGYFDPATNEIVLDAETGMTAHALLHEMVHAATSHTLANKSHPLTKRLTNLYDSLKDLLAGEYGVSSLDEFVSEASSNPEFQQLLAQLEERGGKVTAWQRFKNAVGNFLRGMVGIPPVQPSKTTALDAAQDLIDGIISTAPASRLADSLYMAARDPAEAREVYSKALRNGREPTKANLEDAGRRIVEAGNDGFRWIRKGAMQVTPLHLLVQQAEQYFPSAPKLNDLVNQMSGEQSRARDTLHEFTEDLKKYERQARKSGELETWNTLAHDMTYYQIEPWLDEKAAEKKYGKGSDVEGKLLQYDRLRPMYLALSPEGKKQLHTSVNFFKKLRNDALASAEMSLKQLFPKDAAAVTNLWKTFEARLLAKGVVEPYLPLFREGDYVLTFNAYNPDTRSTEVYSHRFKTERERAAYRAEIEPAIVASFGTAMGMSPENAAKHMDMREAVGRRNVNFNNVPPQTFVGQLMQKLVAKKVEPEVIRAITELVIDTLPETSYAKAFKSRKGVFGASSNMVQAIEERSTSLSRQQVQAKYRGAFQRMKNTLSDEYDRNPATRNSLGARDMLDQLHAISDFAANPTRSKASQIATSLGFVYTLGFNPSSALLNFFQLPGIVLPYLSGKYGMGASMREMRAARQALAGSGRTRVVDVVTDKLDAKGNPIVEQQRVKAVYSISNYDFDAPGMDERTRRLKFLVEEGQKLGQFNRSQVYDILDLDGVEGLGTKISAASGFMMHHSERMVREVTLASTYQLELDRMTKENKGKPLTEAQMREAAIEAVRITEDTNGGVAAGATPRIAHSGLGSVIFMYKRFAVTMYGLLIKTAHQAVKGQSKEARKIAQYQLAGIFGATGMLAGVAGMPLYGVLAMVFNMFRDDDEEDFETLTRMYLGDGPYRGLVNHLTGINVATRIGLSDLLFRENLVEKDQSAIWTMIEQVGGPVIGTALNVERGMSLWSEGEYWRGFENMVPAVLRSLIRAFRFTTQGAETMDGKPIIDDISPVEVAAQALGFNPARYQNQLESNAKKKRFERAVLERRNKLLDSYFYAYFNNDTETMQDIAEDIYDFSEEYPELAITRETLKNSRTQRTRSRENAYHGVTFNEKLRDRAEAFGNV